MQSKRIFHLLSLPIAAILVLSLTACSAKSSDTGKNEDTTQGTVIYGNVTKIEGSAVTLDIGTLNERNRRTPNRDGQPQNSPSGSRPSQPNRSFEPGQGMADLLTLTGESKTVTISDTSILTKQSRQMGGPNGQGGPDGQTPNSSASPRPTMDPSKPPSGNRTNNGGNATEAASLSDISIGSVLKITYQGDTISSIVILNSGTAPTDSALPSPSPTAKQ